VKLKTAAPVLLTVLALTVASLFAQDPTVPARWHAGDDVYAFDVGYKNGATRDIDLTGTWLHYGSDNHRLGINMVYLNNDAGSGLGAGPSYEYLLPMLKRGRLFFGGDATGLSGDLDQAGAIAAAARFGYELYIGTSAALRVQAHQFQVVQPDDTDMADQVDNYGLTFGILLGAPAGVPVN